MSFHPLDPNRFASGLEALSIRSRVEIEQMEVELATKRGALANQTLRAVEQGFLEAEAAYKMHQARMAEAIVYKQEAEQQLAASIAKLLRAKALLHPVRKTPLEVLGTIFEFCLEDLPLHGPFFHLPESVRSRQLQPFQLAAVCRRWRQASLSCPRVWRTIDIHADKISATNQKSWVDYVTLVLERSARTALDIRLFRSVSPNAAPARLVTLLVDSMHRCTSLLISTDVIANGNDVLVPLLKARTPFLRELQLFVSKAGEPGFLQKLHPVSFAPMLQTVRCSFPVSAFPSPLPEVRSWVQLDPIIAAERDDVGSILKLCPRLCELSLSYFSARAARRPDDNVLVNNDLRALRITSVLDGEHLALFARRYHFSGLTSLHLYGSQSTSAQRARYLQEIAPSSPLLCNVWFQSLRASDVDMLLDALRGAPALIFLGLQNCRLDDIDLAFQDAFCRPRDEDGSWICPALTALCFDQSCTVAHGRSLNRLIEMRQRRNHASKNDPRVCRLQHIVFPPTVYQEVKKRIAQRLP